MRNSIKKFTSKEFLLKKITPFSLLTLSILFAWLGWEYMINFIYGEFYIQLFGNPVIYLKNRDSLVAFSFFISSVLFFVFLLRIKNYKITKWLLFAGILSLLGLIALIADEIFNDQFAFVIMFGCIVLACLTMLVIMFVIKKHLWTKLVLLFVNLCFVLSMAYWGISSGDPRENVEQGWKHNSLMLQDKDNSNRKVYMQIRDDEERRIVSEKVMFSVYEYHIMGEQDDNYTWVTPKGNSHANIIVSTHEEILKEIEDGKHVTLLVKGGLSVIGKVFLENKDDITLIGLGEDDVNSSSINGEESISLKDCNNISFENININSPMVFENCNSITIKNCTFSQKALTHLYFDDNCKNIKIENCDFLNYSDYAIDIPFNSISISSNSFYLNGDEERHYDRAFRINVREKLEPFKLDYFYGNLFGSSYSFSNENEYEYSDVCVIGALNEHITNAGIDWTFWRFLEKEMPELNEFSDLNELGLLKMLSGGINPVLAEPANKKYIHSEEVPRYQYINPLFLNWWSKNMIPYLPSEGEVFNIDFQLLYNRAFKYHAHAFIESYLYLKQSFDIEKEAEWYLEASEDDWTFVDKLRNKYAYIPLSMDFLNEESANIPEDIEYLESGLGKVVGFWVRRHIDGTDKQIFDIAKKVIREYDPEFYDWILNENFKYTEERGDIVYMKNFVKPYLTNNEFEFLAKTLDEYPLISTDKEMAEFYLNNMNPLISSLNSGMYKYNNEKDLVDEGELANDWNSIISDCMPYLLIEFDNTFEGACAYENISEFIKVSQTTEGVADDLFFETLSSCYGIYHSVYVTNLNDYDGGGYSHSKLGDGNHIEVLRKAIAANSESSLFKERIEQVVDVVLSFDQKYFFGNSKDEVYKELDKIIALQDNTNLDFSQAKDLKSRLDAATEGVYYNCKTGDCYEYYNQ